jgi:hypothetical protein
LRSADALDQSIIIRRCGDSSRIFTDDCRIALNGSAYDYVPSGDLAKSGLMTSRPYRIERLRTSGCNGLRNWSALLCRR